MSTLAFCSKIQEYPRLDNTIIGGDVKGIDNFFFEGVM
jgi:hypothetical protein